MVKVLLPIKPEYALAILEGRKTYEYRKNCFKSDVSHIIIYASAPLKKVIGEVEYKGYVSDSPEMIWEKTNDKGCISKEKYDAYFANSELAYAYKLGKVTKFNEYKELSDYGIDKAPQSYTYVHSIDVDGQLAPDKCHTKDASKTELSNEDALDELEEIAMLLLDQYMDRVAYLEKENDILSKRVKTLRLENGMISDKYTQVMKTLYGEMEGIPQYDDAREIRFTIPVAPRTKKNSGRIVVNKEGKKMLIPSASFMQYQKDALWFVPVRYIKDRINVKATYYMDTKRKVDLTNLNEALHDIMVVRGCVEDDNSNIIVSSDGSRVAYDKDNPRTEVVIQFYKK